MQEIQTRESHEMTNEQVTQFIEERLQLLEKKGKVNHGEPYPETEKETRPSLFSSIKKIFRDFFGKRKDRTNHNNVI